MSFRERSTFAQIGPGRFTGTLTEDWYQGRGVYGGMIAAIVVRALERSVDAERLPRSLSIAFCAPAGAGEASVETRIEREGRYVSELSARLTREGEVVATARATFARPRESILQHLDLPLPSMPPPADVPEGPPAVFIPAFCAHTDLRWCLGDRPFEGAFSPHVGGWCRLRERGDLDAAAMAALLDAWPPAALSLYSEWTPAASIEMGVHFHCHRAGDAYCAFEARSRVIAGGYADEQSTLWYEDGTPLATARQLVALFK